MPESATKITYGISGVRFFKIDSYGTDGYPVYNATPIDWKGAREISTKPLGEDKILYADDMAYVTVRGQKGVSGSFTAFTMPNGIKQHGLGYYEDLNKAMVVNAGAKAELGLIYELKIQNEDGTNDYELHTLYRTNRLSRNIPAKQMKEHQSQKNFPCHLQQSKSRILLTILSLPNLF